MVRLMAPLADDLADPLAPYADADRCPRPGGCWVLSNMVIGLDGTAAVNGKVGALSTPRDAELFRRLRALADVVLVGAETVRRERYGPVRLADDLAAARRQRGQSDPVLAVVSSSLDLDPGLPLFANADTARRPLVLTGAASDPSLLADVSEVLVVGDERVDLYAALAELARRSLPIVLCEGGPTLLGELITADLLDEYCLTVAPLIGGDPLPAVDTSGLAMLRRFRLAHVAEEDDTLFLRYVREESP
jgi:riboflavin biosynthesis pyrimidine reductase